MSESNHEAGTIAFRPHSFSGSPASRELFLPYGVADTSIAFCRINVGELLAELV